MYSPETKEKLDEAITIQSVLLVLSLLASLIYGYVTESLSWIIQRNVACFICACLTLGIYSKIRFKVKRCYAEVLVSIPWGIYLVFFLDGPYVFIMMLIHLIIMLNIGDCLSRKYRGRCLF